MPFWGLPPFFKILFFLFFSKRLFKCDSREKVTSLESEKVTTLESEKVTNANYRVPETLMKPLEPANRAGSPPGL